MVYYLTHGIWVSSATARKYNTQYQILKYLLLLKLAWYTEKQFK